MPQRRPPRNQAGQPDTQIAREFREAVSKLAPIVAGEFVPAINEFGENIKKTAEAIKRFNRLEVYGTFAALAYQIKAFTSIQKSLSQSFLNQFISSVTEIYKKILNPILSASDIEPFDVYDFSTLIVYSLDRLNNIFRFYKDISQNIVKQTLGPNKFLENIILAFILVNRFTEFFKQFMDEFTFVHSEFKHINVSELNLEEIFNRNKEGFIKSVLVMLNDFFEMLSENAENLLLELIPEGDPTREQRLIDFKKEYNELIESLMIKFTEDLPQKTELDTLLSYFVNIFLEFLRGLNILFMRSTKGLYEIFKVDFIRRLTGTPYEVFDQLEKTFEFILLSKIPKNVLIPIATLVRSISPLLYHFIKTFFKIQENLQPSKFKKSFFDPLLNFFKSIGDSFSKLIPGPVAKAIGRIKTAFTNLAVFVEKAFPVKFARLALIAAPFLIQYIRSYRQLFAPIETRAQYSAVVAGSLAHFNRAVRLLQIEVAQRTALASMLATATARQLLENTKETVILLAKLVLYMSVLIGQILRPIVWLIDQIARVVNWLEELLAHIASFFGYKRQENRPASDIFFDFMRNVHKEKGIVPLPPEWNRQPGDF